MHVVLGKLIALGALLKQIRHVSCCFSMGNIQVIDLASISRQKRNVFLSHIIPQHSTSLKHSAETHIIHTIVLTGTPALKDIASEPVLT